MHAPKIENHDAVAGQVERPVRPEPVERLRRYAGQTMRTARSPNLTAREAIAVGNWMAEIEAELGAVTGRRHVQTQAAEQPSLSDRLASIWGELDPVDEWRPVIKDAVAELSRLTAEAADLRQQLWDEKRQHEITRGDLARTRLACDELLAADDGRNVVIGGRPAPVAICTRMDLTDAQREQLRTTMVVTRA